MTDDAWSPSERELERRAVRRRQATVSVVVATLVTVVVFGLLVVGVWSSPGWPRVHETFFDGFHAKESFAAIRHGFWINVKLFLICEPIILVVALAIALARTARAPWLLPVRLLAVLYTDVVRGIPTILLIVLFAFGMPALRLQGLPDSAAVLVRGRADRLLQRVRRRGLPRRHRLDPPLAGAERGRARAQPRPVDAVRRGAAGGAPRRTAAAQRLRLAAEGHRAGRPPPASSTRCSRRGTTATSTSTTRRSSSSPASSW